jgi:hypothetical protein
MRILVALLALAWGVSAQPISVGIRGGVPVTDAFSTVLTTSGNNFVKSFSNSKEYEIGPMIELHLPFGLAVEADALYHPLNLATEISASPGPHPGLYQYSTNFNSWEFPILAKYHILPLPLVKPYVEAGPAFRALSQGASYLSGHGFAVGGGVEVKLFRLRLEPEIRYTHWGSDTPSAMISGATPSNTNQAAILLGISF